MRKSIKEVARRPEAIENMPAIGLPMEELIRQGARQQGTVFKNGEAVKDNLPLVDQRLSA